MYYSIRVPVSLIHNLFKMINSVMQIERERENENDILRILLFKSIYYIFNSKIFQAFFNITVIRWHTWQTIHLDVSAGESHLHLAGIYQVSAQKKHPDIYKLRHLQVKFIRAEFIITVTVSKGFPTPTLCEQWMHAVTVSAFRLWMSNKTPTKTLVSNMRGRERDYICLHVCATERERDARHAFTNFWFAVPSRIN